MRNILGAWSRSPRPSKLQLAVIVNTLLYSDPFAGMGGGGEGRGVSGGEKPSDFAVLTRLYHTRYPSVVDFIQSFLGLRLSNSKIVKAWRVMAGPPCAPRASCIARSAVDTDVQCEVYACPMPPAK